jgi:hypothetical protein
MPKCSLSINLLFFFCLCYALLQKQFVVSTGNRYLVLVIESDTLCVIKKMAHVWCQLMSTNIKDHLLGVRQAIFGVG